MIKNCKPQLQFYVLKKLCFRFVWISVKVQWGIIQKHSARWNTKYKWKYQDGGGWGGAVVIIITVHIMCVYLSMITISSPYHVLWFRWSLAIAMVRQSSGMGPHDTLNTKWHRGRQGRHQGPLVMEGHVDTGRVTQATGDPVSHSLVTSLVTRVERDSSNRGDGYQVTRGLTWKVTQIQFF